MRFAEFWFSNVPEAVFVVGIGLNGLALVCRINGGGGLPGVPLPAVRGRSGSSRPAFEPLRFSDCAVGRAKAGWARKDEAWFAIESIFLNSAM